MSQDHRSDAEKQAERDHMAQFLKDIPRPCYVHTPELRKYLNPYDPRDHECSCGEQPTGAGR